MKMMKVLFLAVMIFLSLRALNGQHGTSSDGLDTWTGLVSAVNIEKQEITLTAKKGSETFILPQEQTKPGEKANGPRISDLAVGQMARVTYMKLSYKDNGKTINRNMVVNIELLSPKK